MSAAIIAAKQNKANEFPIVCDDCLGSNPYVRMTRRTLGAECRFCQRVYTSFSWKRAKSSGVMRTEICPICSTMKNLCQSCVLDLDFHLPSYVRDSILPESAASNPNSERSQLTTTYLAEQAERLITEGGVNAHLLASEVAPSKQQLLDLVMSATQEEALAENLTQNTSVSPPKDLKIKSLYVGGIDESSAITELNLQGVFGSFGAIKDIKMAPQHNCAFVTFNERKDAEACMSRLSNKLVVQGKQLKILWAKPKRKQISKKVEVQASEEVNELSDEEKERRALLDFLANPNHFLIPPVGSDQGAVSYPSMTPSN